MCFGILGEKVYVCKVLYRRHCFYSRSTTVATTDAEGKTERHNGKGVTERMTSKAKSLKPVLIPKEIREKTKYCFECGICTASCPMAELLSTRYNPRSLLQKVLTEPEKTLNENSLWLCAWCYECYKRCPQGLKPPEIFQLLKSEAVKR